jgi:hypothetical protein
LQVIEDAKKTCEENPAEECAAAWDEVCVFACRSVRATQQLKDRLVDAYEESTFIISSASVF